MATTEQKEIHIKNRKASFEYSLLDRYTAGMQLKGTEIKSVREGKANISDAFCFFDNGELWVKGLHISPFSKAAFFNHEEVRNRKLLLHKKELKKINNSVTEGVTIVPLELFINKKGWAKLEIALAKGKKQFDKRETIKKRELQRKLGRKVK
ncbi:MAG: SsrA-binding protein SmpB [Bacteroidia bacterium]|jgi:SsrA-binding protein|nr:SsrA-binding protein SmpB [Bacteroidia bacterium]